MLAAAQVVWTNPGQEVITPEDIRLQRQASVHYGAHCWHLEEALRDLSKQLKDENLIFFKYILKPTLGHIGFLEVSIISPGPILSLLRTNTTKFKP